MSAVSKRMSEAYSKVEKGKEYDVVEAFEILAAVSKVKFKETVEVSVRLGIDPRKSDQALRGSLVLPNGTGQEVRVAVFAQGEKAEAAKKAGADIVGFEDLAEKVTQGEMDFDLVIATTDSMPVVGKLGRVLGPRGLMPNPKVGTVTDNVAEAVKKAKGGQVQFRADKSGNVHTIIGKIDFTAANLKENLESLVNELKRMKPASAKGVYLKSVSVTSTMGPGIKVSLGSLKVN